MRIRGLAGKSEERCNLQEICMDGRRISKVMF
jgi:hypothetical protein